MLWIVAGFHLASSSIQVVNAASAPQPTIDTAIQAVVRILPQRCGPAGCRQLSVGSGAIVHPSGVILTAWHVTVEDPGNLVSPAYADDFVVEMTEDVRRQPVPRYRAELIAVKPEMDLALLRIYQEIGTNRPLAQDSANALPTLPISDNIPSTGQLRIMGYPLAGGGSIKYPEFGISGFTDDGTLMTIQGTLSPGYSGGPALFEQDGRFAIVGVVIRRRGDLGEVGLLRSIDQLKELTWEPTARRVWAENVQVSMTASICDRLRVRENCQIDGRIVM